MHVETMGQFCPFNNTVKNAETFLIVIINRTGVPLYSVNGHEGCSSTQYNKVLSCTIFITLEKLILVSVI